MERLTPHDIIFPFTTYLHLKDSKLSAACSLHTASASVKSSSDSLRPLALSEIAEDAHEYPLGVEDDHNIPRVRGFSIGSDNTRTESTHARDVSGHQRPSQSFSDKRTPSPSRSTRTIRNTNKALPPTPNELDHEKKLSVTGSDDYRHELRYSPDLRSSFQPNRPSTRELHSSYEYKPKIKLGPRPSTDSVGRSLASDSPRPISTLPASVRISPRKTLPTRPRSHHSQKSNHDPSSSKLTLSPPLPVLPIHNSGPVSDTKMNVTVTPARIIPSKSPGITPEKRRLMKALQLRQKQMAAQNSTEAFKTDSTGPVLEKDEPVPETPVDNSSSKIDSRVETSAINPSSKDATSDAQSVIIDVPKQSEYVQINVQDDVQANPGNVESSPISILDPSDGPSTQASSVTEEENPSVLEKINTKSSASLMSSKSHDALVEKEDAPILKMSKQEQGAGLVPSQSRDLVAKDNEIESDQSGSKPLSSLSSQTPILEEELITPHQVPLPPVDDDEEFFLKSQRGSFDAESQNQSNNQPAKARLSMDSNLTDRPPYLDQDSTAPRTSTGDTFDAAIDRASRKHGLALSIRASSPENSDDHFLSDDSFMEELGSATVQEAKPVSVSLSKSPVTPVFPAFPNDYKLDDMVRTSRSVSNTLEDRSKDDAGNLSIKSPPYMTNRSYSASHQVTLQTQQASAIMLKKVGVSSGISQRIKALEKLSSRPTSPSSQGPSNSSTTVTSPTFIGLRKTTLKSPHASSESIQSISNRSRQKIPSHPPSPPDAVLNSRKDKFVNLNGDSKSQKSRPESVSVTATIIRDSRVMPAASVNPSELSNMNLHKSPLMVEHQTVERSSPRSSFKPPRSRFNQTRSVSSSSIDRKSEPSQTSRRDSFASRRSMTSGRGSEVDLPRSISDTSINGMNGLDGMREEKKESRKSRLFKRMSGISSASRRSIVQALNLPVKEEPIVEHHETVYQAPLTMADFGDVNIQFPDTLVSSQFSQSKPLSAKSNLAMEKKRHEN